MTEAKVKVDFASMHTLCGDPSSHILEALESVAPGDIVEVVYTEGDASVEEAVETITSAGLAELVAKSCENKICKAYLKKVGE